MKLITITFSVILIIIVIVANLGLGPTFFPIVYKIPWGDKIGHFLLIGTLSFLVNYVLSSRRVSVLSQSILLGSAIVLVIVTIEEFSQIFLDYRSFSIIDLAFDYSGILFFGYLASNIHEHQLKEKEED